jgi:hypothetical protein
MRRVPLALAGGLACVVVALGLSLSEAPLTIAGTNGIKAHHDVGNTGGEITICQAGGTLPKGTSAIRVSLSANIGPLVTVKLTGAGRVLARGTRRAGWGISETVTVPIKRAPASVAGVTVCTTAGRSIENVEINGSVLKTIDANGRSDHAIALRVEYLRTGHASWLSLASSVTRHLGLGRSPSGTWLAYLVMALMMAVAGLTSRLLLRELQ